MGYGLDFANSGDMITSNSDAELDNLDPITQLAWIRPTNVGVDARIIQKGLAASGFRDLAITTVAEPYAEMARGTQSALVKSSNPLVSVNTWTFIVGQLSSAGASTDQKILVGLVVSAVAEAVAYATQRAGSGTVGDNSATDQIFGNRSSGGAQVVGTIACVQIYNRLLNLGELESLRTRPGACLSGCVSCIIFGLEGSTGTQVDHSGNGNDGTVIGATASAQQLPFVLYGNLANGGANTRSLVGRGLVG